MIDWERDVAEPVGRTVRNTMPAHIRFAENFDSPDFAWFEASADGLVDVPVVLLAFRRLSSIRIAAGHDKPFAPEEIEVLHVRNTSQLCSASKPGAMTGSWTVACDICCNSWTTFISSLRNVRAGDEM